jgi:type II secretory pathway pseudopilin PulG
MPKKHRWNQNAYAILRAMKGGKKPRGFTVIETLLVLAVSGGLFVVVAITLSGRQARTQFTQSVQEVQSQIQQVINDVGSGFYPSNSTFSCSATLTGPSISSGSTEQGGNGGCIFLGKAIQFGVNGTDPEQFKVITIAGLQRTPAGDEVTTYAEAHPKAVASGVDLTDTKNLLYGLTAGSMRYGASSTDVGTVAFVNSLASYSSGSIVSGSQQVKVIPISGSALGQTQAQAAGKIDDNLASSTVDPSGGIKICFVSGTTDQSGLVTIGSNGRQLSVTLDIKGNKTCS